MLSVDRDKPMRSGWKVGDRDGFLWNFTLRFDPSHHHHFGSSAARPILRLIGPTISHSFRPFVCIHRREGERELDRIMAAVHSLCFALSPVQRPLLLRSAARVSRRDGTGRDTRPLRLPRLRRGRGTAVAGEVDAPVEQAEAVVRTASENGDAASTVVSVLLTLAFVGLSLLTVGLIYLAVQDFLQKREREKFEKEEAERLKEEAKKKKAKARGRRRTW